MKMQEKGREEVKNLIKKSQVGGDHMKTWENGGLLKMRLEYIADWWKARAFGGKLSSLRNEIKEMA